MLEAKCIETGSLDDAFKARTKASVVACFRRGLLPEIESRLPATNDANDVLQTAIKIERALEAQKAFRSNNSSNVLPRQGEVPQSCFVGGN